MKHKKLKKIKKLIWKIIRLLIPALTLILLSLIASFINNPINVNLYFLNF